MQKDVSGARRSLLSTRPITAELRREHEIISMTAVAMSRDSRAMLRGALAAEESLRRGLEVLRDFGDACHHRKEEQVLIPALWADETLDVDEELDRIIEDHKHGRDLLARISDGLFEGETNEQTRVKVTALCESYKKHIISHIRFENTWFFPLVEKQLALQAPIIQKRMDLIEERFGGEDRHRRFTETARELRQEALLMPVALLSFPRKRESRE